MKAPHQPMERNPTRPSQVSQMEDVWREIRRIWQRVGNGRAGEVHDVAFSLGGPIYVSTSGGYYLPFSSGVMTNILITLRVAGTTTTTVAVYRVQAAVTTTVATVSLAAGVRSIRTSIANEPSLQGDADETYVGVTAAGAGAEGLTVQTRFRIL